MNGIEIERKYIIKLPKLEKMKQMSGYAFRDITQVYMPTVNGVSHRIRKSISCGVVEYTETKKLRIDEMSAYEDERIITEDEYLKLLGERDAALSIINKRRHTFLYLGQLFEIDVYPEWRSCCIMETELASRTDTPKMPSFIEIIGDVTANRAYSNHSMSKRFPDEPCIDRADLL